MLLSERTKTRRGKWEYLRTMSLVEAVHTARDMGWADKKVQVRVYQTGIYDYEYSVEPYENCGCSNLLKYEDYTRVEESNVR